MVHYKLTYFPFRGAAETIRQIFAFAGQTYVDFRLPMEQWEGFKDSTPFGKLPILEVDGKVLGQSHAIARYLANEFGLNGKNEWEKAEVNSLADQFADYILEARPYLMALSGFYPGDPIQLRTSLFLPTIDKHISIFERILEENSSGFLVGNSLTWVDLLLSQHIEQILYTDLAALEKFKNVLKHRKMVQNLPAIKSWIARRPETPW
ncbi:unnamed protein product [Caenorhabditis angaria]|uniref:glutathione transferase n=1 Tax=Caenorhabditis angaria TaxID=860376 RepID=A0A9P1IER6_9PELO|nr:unnamed protein product [Caenorhabditis angaria]